MHPAHSRFFALIATLLIAVASAFAQGEQPLRELPYTPGLDVSAMDTRASPCEDFYQYSCGGWMQNNPIPPDQSRWSVYGKLYQDNQRFLWGILDQLAQHNAGSSGAQQQLGDYFAACMDESRIEQLGAAPLQTWLQQVNAIASRADLARFLARAQLATGHSGLFFGFGSDQDFSNSTSVIAFAVGGGLSLPDRDYYLKSDEPSVALRQKYLSHMANTFALLGEAEEEAARGAATVLRVETALARATLSQVNKRDPYKLFHKMKRAQLQALTLGFDWDSYFSALALGDVNAINITEPAFFKALARQLRSLPLADIKVYLRWHLTHAMSPLLSTPFVNAHFDFFSRTLLGVPQLAPRWKRCVGLADAQLGEALGQEFVTRSFAPELKAKTLQMTLQIEQAMHDDLQQLDWMSATTKARAVEKLKTIINKIGYPDRWRDYSAVLVSRDDFFGNVTRATLFETRRQLDKIGKPLDRGEWGMTPPTVNAYYSAQMNDINFPAGVLQPPLYDPRMDDAPNYGNTGGTIGHELTHAFDDEGRQFDAQGNLKNWWTPQDNRRFNARTACIVKQYGQYTVVDDIKIKSRLTLGEDIADLGGMVLAWTAWKMQTANVPQESRDGLTPEQRFFVGFAQWACENNRPEDLRVKAVTDPHSPGRYRVNGVVANMPEFARAFACKPGSAMVSAKPCKVW
jgi:endothelin-converting enzyme/putative endopeptidase